MTCNAEDLFARHRPLPSDDTAVWSQHLASRAGADGTAAAVVLGIPALQVPAGCIDYPELPGTVALGNGLTMVQGVFFKLYNFKIE